MTTQKSQTEPKHISYAFELQDAYNKGFKEGKLQAISEFIKWLNFEFDKIDIISKERGNSEKVRFLFCSDLMDKREELKQLQEQEGK